MNNCRTCLNSKPRKTITDLQTASDINQGDKIKSSVDVMEFCLGIKVPQDEYNNTKLCLKCYRALKSFYNFKLTALKSDLYIKSLQVEDIDSEFIEIEKSNNIFVKDHKQILELTNGEEECYVSLKNEINDNGCTKYCVENEIKLEICDQCDNVDSIDNFESYDVFLSDINSIKNESSADEKYEKDNAKAESPKEEEQRSERKPKHKMKRELTQKCTKKQSYSLGNVKDIRVDGICDQCGKYARCLKEHMQTHLPEKVRKCIPCKQCDKMFSNHSARYRHIKIKHRGVKEHCDICNKDVVYLKTHKLAVHKPQDLPYPCLLCDRRFVSPSALATHVTLHTKDRPYQCDICQKGFRSKSYLIMHTRQVHLKEKSHMCQFCSKSFFKKDHLKNHIRSHTKERPFECRECGKRFTTSQMRRSHEDTHSTERRYKCEMCDMAFVKRNYLKNHMISHTRERKHVCSFCGVKFGRSDHRRRHELTAHLKQTRGAGGTCPAGDCGVDSEPTNGVTDVSVT